MNKIKILVFFATKTERNTYLYLAGFTGSNLWTKTIIEDYKIKMKLMIFSVVSLNS